MGGSSGPFPGKDQNPTPGAVFEEVGVDDPDDGALRVVTIVPARRRQAAHDSSTALAARMLEAVENHPEQYTPQDEAIERTIDEALLRLKDNSATIIPDVALEIQNLVERVNGGITDGRLPNTDPNTEIATPIFSNAQFTLNESGKFDNFQRGAQVNLEGNDPVLRWFSNVVNALRSLGDRAPEIIGVFDVQPARYYIYYRERTGTE